MYQSPDENAPTQPIFPAPLHSTPPPPPPPRPPRGPGRSLPIAALLIGLGVLGLFGAVALAAMRKGLLTAVATATVVITATAAPTMTPAPTATPLPTFTPAPTTTPIPSLDQRIDAYIATMSLEQQVGQTLMIAVYANSYDSDLDQALTQWHAGSAIVFTNYNGGALEPPTLGGLKQLVSDLESHANTPLLLATDEEGGEVDRLAPYFGATPSPQSLTATGNPQNAYNQAQTDAAHMRDVGLNVDFAPLADIYQGGAIDQSRMFGTSVNQVTQYAGAFLDGLQQHGVAGTLKHWPGLGAANGNPDNTFPTVNHTKAQLNAIDFASFKNLLSRQPGMIMVTHVLVPAYDTAAPASLSPVLVNQVLRGQLGYQGVIVTDAMDAQGIQQYMQQQGYNDPAAGVAEACVRAFLAGNDLIEAPIEQDRLAATVTALTQAVQSGRISPDRLRQSVHRIIRMKVQLGLLTLP